MKALRSPSSVSPDTPARSAVRSPSGVHRSPVRSQTPALPRFFEENCVPSGDNHNFLCHILYNGILPERFSPASRHNIYTLWECRLIPEMKIFFFGFPLYCAVLGPASPAAPIWSHSLFLMFPVLWAAPALRYAILILSLPVYPCSVRYLVQLYFLQPPSVPSKVI